MEKVLCSQPCYCETEGREILTGSVRMVAGVASADQVATTVVCLLLGSSPRICHGYDHGRSITSETPLYLKKVALLHVLWILKGWLHGADQQLRQNIHIRSGVNDLTYQINRRFKDGVYRLSSAAATEVAQELQNARTWLTTPTALWP